MPSPPPICCCSDLLMFHIESSPLQNLDVIGYYVAIGIQLRIYRIRVFSQLLQAVDLPLQIYNKENKKSPALTEPSAHSFTSLVDLVCLIFLFPLSLCLSSACIDMELVYVSYYLFILHFILHKKWPSPVLPSVFPSFYLYPSASVYISSLCCNLSLSYTSLFFVSYYEYRAQGLLSSSSSSFMYISRSLLFSSPCASAISPSSTQIARASCSLWKVIMLQ